MLSSFLMPCCRVSDASTMTWCLARMVVSTACAVTSSVPLMAAVRFTKSVQDSQSVITRRDCCSKRPMTKRSGPNAFEPMHMLRFLDASWYVKQVVRHQASRRGFHPRLGAELHVVDESRPPGRTALTVGRARFFVSAVLMARYRRREDLHNCAGVVLTRRTWSAFCQAPHSLTGFVGALDKLIRVVTNLLAFVLRVSLRCTLLLLFHINLPGVVCYTAVLSSSSGELSWFPVTWLCVEQSAPDISSGVQFECRPR